MQGCCITFNERWPCWLFIPSGRIPRLAVNTAVCPLEKTLVYPNSPSCICIGQSSPPQRNVFPSWGWAVSILRFSPGPMGTPEAASVLYGRHVSLVSLALWPLPADRVPQEVLVIIATCFVYNFAQCHWLRSSATAPTTPCSLRSSKICHLFSSSLKPQCPGLDYGHGTLFSCHTPLSPSPFLNCQINTKMHQKKGTFKK